MQTETTALPKQVTLANCDREPIHLSGMIQSHGALIVADSETFRVSAASDNVREILGFGAAAALGRDLFGLFAPEISRQIRANLSLASEARQIFKISEGDTRLNVVAQTHDGNLLVEFERESLETKVHGGEIYGVVRQTISRLRSSPTLESLYVNAVNEIRDLTGFNRVLIYRFDERWDGHVLAEARGERIASYLDHHFPASDIPKPARDLYYLNRLRYIPAIQGRQSRLLCASGAVEDIDLSLSSLRSVSPIHIEYLTNMGVNASMSLSLIHEGRLWGLISCTHEEGPIALSLETRGVCELIAEVTSSLLALRSEQDSDARFARKTQLERRLLESMAYHDNFVDGLARNSEAFLELTGADGAAIYHEGEFVIFGEAPEPAGLTAIVEWLNLRAPNEMVVSHRLQRDMERDFVSAIRPFCGLLAFAIAGAQTTRVLWFRKEVIKTLKWGGNPEKPARSDQRLMHPRRSFATWLETVSDTAPPWDKFARDAAANLKSAIIEVVLRRVERISSLNRELERSNTELDSFAYAASHDLKEPLRGIHNYSAILLRETAGKLGAEDQTRLASIARLTQRMEALIDSLLTYAQVGRAELAMRSTDLNQVFKAAIDNLKTRIEESHATVSVSPLPTVVCDRSQMIEVFTNLISNAIKYNDQSEKRVDVGVEVFGDQPRFFVRDNGIGIPRAGVNQIFKIFKRLHPKQAYGGGTGTGLTITEKIVERHGGKIWVDSVPGVGSTFWFVLGERALGFQQ